MTKKVDIPPEIKCHKCETLLLNAYECEEKCRSYCGIHLPEKEKCEKCGGKFSFNQKQTQTETEEINSERVKCLNCGKEMLLKDFDSHLLIGNECNVQSEILQNCEVDSNPTIHQIPTKFQIPQKNQEKKRKRERNEKLDDSSLSINKVFFSNNFFFVFFLIFEKN